jgi:hypothetical protein
LRQHFAWSKEPSPDCSLDRRLDDLSHLIGQGFQLGVERLQKLGNLELNRTLYVDAFAELLELRLQRRNSAITSVARIGAFSLWHRIRSILMQRRSRQAAECR